MLSDPYLPTQFSLLQVVALLAGASAVSAHGHILNWIIDGETKNGGQPVYNTYGVSPLGNASLRLSLIF